MLKKLSITDVNLAGKRVFMRVDFNVPLDADLKITDDTRIRASLPSIMYALENGARLILASHMGRPKGQRVATMSMQPVAERLAELLKTDVIAVGDCVGPEIEEITKSLEDGQVMLLENLRYYKEETDNCPDFAKGLAKLADLYINDAFGTAHRAHASTEGITHHLDTCAAGFLIAKEIEYFDNVIAAPKSPFVAILGGAKISTKIPVIENLIDKVDTLLIGGGMAFTFLKAMGAEIGKSLLEENMVEQAKGFIERAEAEGKALLLPTDVIVADAFSNDANNVTVSWEEIPANWMGLDIGPATAKAWSEVVQEAKTVVWNGPMGAFEMSNFANGTIELGKAVGEMDGISIVGGGDSVAALDVIGIRDKVSHVSTGGGASLDFLAGKVLPGIDALNDK
jgi:phosphoglycerate kinase